MERGQYYEDLQQHSRLRVGDRVRLMKLPIQYEGGYTGNIFAITDIASEYEYVCLDTGGRQWALCVSGMPQGSRDFPTDFLFAICENRSDERNDIMRSAFGWGDSKRRQPPLPIGAFLRGSRSSQ